MKICVFGAGAIGGYMAGELALAGHEVCAIARGCASGRPFRDTGSKLIVEGQARTVELPASDGPCHVWSAGCRHLCAEGTAGPCQRGRVRCAPRSAHGCSHSDERNSLVVFSTRSAAPWTAIILESVDPGGAQWNAIGPERAIGCVVDPACEVVAPG